jgi:hypothetical protein
MPANPHLRTLRKVANPLREETQKVRKALFVWCLAAIAITLGKLFPSEITALGMKVTATSHSVLLALMAVVVGYHMVTFLVYAATDFAHWYVSHFSTEWEEDVANYEAYKAELLARAKLSDEDRQFMEEHERRLGSLWRGEALQTYIRLEKVIPYISYARAVIDFLLPLLVGGIGLYLLISGSRNAL